MIEAVYKHRCNQQVTLAQSESLFSNDLVLLGRGSGRLCYQHPFDATLCIKLPRNARGENESRREYRYMKLIDLVHKEDTRNRITAFHGRICTSAGIGWVVEKVLAENGDSIAPELHECLTPDAFALETTLWQQAFDDFMEWSFNTAVVVRDASVNNICVKRLDSGALRFVLIDGVGPRGILPQWLPIKRYARKRNRVHAKRSEFTSIENLVIFCEKLRQDQQYHRDNLVDVPVKPVRCLLSST